ncbi:P-loop containing nucleoside triphosphate hydrolase protein, partial [Ceraceosorus guamensis]
MSTFWKPGTAQPGSSADRIGASSEEAESAFQHASAINSSSRSLQEERKALPIYEQKERILYAVQRYGVVVIVGQTGCGKTTQIPQYLLEAGWAPAHRAQSIVCTQPRRLSCLSISMRVSAEQGCSLGSQVGYAVPFERHYDARTTRIKYATHGTLFRELMSDPLLSAYSVVMIDEAHERNAFSDLLLILLKKIRRKRPSLRIIVSSATIDAQAFLNFFLDKPYVGQERQAGGAQAAAAAGAAAKTTAATTTTQRSNNEEVEDGIILSLQGRTFPVEIAYAQEAVEDYVKASVEAVWQLHLAEARGDILVFLTGKEEIDACMQALADRQISLPQGSLPLHLLPVHAGLSAQEQMALFDPTPRGGRRCLVATNIAEASVTLPGIRYVVDCGLVKMRLFDPESGTESLCILPISQASAAQRSGRAGRTSAGKALRLYTRSTFRSLAPHTSPELSRSDLTSVVLQLKSLGVDDLVRKFEWMWPAPSTRLLSCALQRCAVLGAMDAWARLTPDGQKMAELPLDPIMGKLLLQSIRFQCSKEILSVIAMLSVSSPFIIPDEKRNDAAAYTSALLSRDKFTAEEGDHLSLLNVYDAFVDPQVGASSRGFCKRNKLAFAALARAVSIRQQLQGWMKRLGWEREARMGCEGDEGRLRRCLVSALFENAARRMEDGGYRSIRAGQTLHIHPSSVLFDRIPKSKYVIFQEVVQTNKRYMRDVTVVEE